MDLTKTIDSVKNVLEDKVPEEDWEIIALQR